MGPDGRLITIMDWKALQNGSDIRGIAMGPRAELTPEVAHRLGRAFAAWLARSLERAPEGLTVAVGRDSRLTGPDLMSSLMQGLARDGLRVFDLGLASTPAMFMSTVTPGYACDGAVMLTASHLPPDRNGCKFFTRQGGLNRDDVSVLLELAESGDFLSAPGTGAIMPVDFMTVYARQLVERIRNGVAHPEHPERPLQGLRIVVDAGNGAAGFFVDRVLQPLGADTTGSQYLEPDGTFPNHVPNPEHPDAMAALTQAVTAQRVDFGIVFDPDVDRAAAVDSDGRAINRNRLVALAAAMVLREHPGSTVVTDSITSDGLTDFIERDLGGVHRRFKRGYRNVINEALRLNAAGQECWLAIETSGHAALKENHFLDDGAYLMAMLLIELARARREGRSLGTLIATLREPAESAEIRIGNDDRDFRTSGNQVIDALRARAGVEPDWKVVPDNYEGVRVACRGAGERGWFLLRLSLHDPVLALNIESETPGGAGRIAHRLLPLLQGFDALELSALETAAKGPSG
ncbi:Phosphomannomutase [Thioalkalivibrio nitratireducens DSM 14787]|uniref:Phosphomannomutase n=1 Tax=Thioalkalivibrio nitratireducens (strain DSM 14787 / UNIQEM 213 / ALEN2) TaxID=1255043 RepID=L0E1W7_THIND|nr:Phosphomannomutase [Thioalkalivibrio nitratireducens DSM 14787]